MSSLYNLLSLTQIADHPPILMTLTFLLLAVRQSISSVLKFSKLIGTSLLTVLRVDNYNIKK